MSVSAVVVCHQDKNQLIEFLDHLKHQSQPLDEIIVCVCCMDTSEVEADIILLDKHRDDTGQSKCDMGLRLSTSDYTLLCSSDDEYLPEFIETLSRYDADLILGAFRSHLVGEVVDTKPLLGRVTRGSFLVKTDFANKVGYNHRVYDGDGLFVMDLIDAGASWVSDPNINYLHN